MGVAVTLVLYPDIFVSGNTFLLSSCIAVEVKILLMYHLYNIQEHLQYKVCISMNIIPGDDSLKSIVVLGKYVLVNSIKFSLNDLKSLLR